MRRRINGGNAHWTAGFCALTTIRVSDTVSDTIGATNLEQGIERVHDVSVK